MDDLISRQAAISAICNACGKIDCDKMDKCEKLQLPPANCSEFPNNSDTISRQAVIDALNGIINRFEQILRDIRESKVDDSVCGMCEYDGAFVGQSGDWCNECPGFEKDDCFRLSDECRKRWLESVELPAAQPDIIYCKDCVKHNKGLGNYEVHPDGSGTWIWKDSACPLVSWRDKAQGHEFDYQFCAYAERREVTE